MSELELGGAAFGLLSVWLTVRASIWCWPTGIVSTALFVIMFTQARLYGDAITNVMFSVVSVYGWIAWSRSRRDDPSGGIRWGGPRVQLLAAVICAAGIPICGWVFRWAGGVLPYWDAAIMVLSFVAQALLTRKLVESWVLWIIVDVLSVGVYTSRGLLVTAGLYLVFLGLASRGLVTWRRLTLRRVRP